MAIDPAVLAEMESELSSLSEQALGAAGDLEGLGAVLIAMQKQFAQLAEALDDGGTIISAATDDLASAVQETTDRIARQAGVLGPPLAEFANQLRQGVQSLMALSKQPAATLPATAVSPVPSPPGQPAASPDLAGFADAVKEAVKALGVFSLTARTTGPAKAGAAPSLTTPAASPEPAPASGDHADAASGVQGAMGVMKGGMASAAPMIGTALAGPIGGAVGQAIGPALADPLGTLMTPISMLKDSLMSIKGAFDSVVSTVRPFVQAFAPSTIMAFDMSMRDVNAVIGRAFLPVMQGAVQAVRAVGDVLVPVMRKIEPVIKGLVEAFQGWFQPALANVSGWLNLAADALTDVWTELKTFGPLFDGLMSAWRTAAAFVQGFASQLWENVKALYGMLSGFLGMKGPMNSFGEGLRKLSLQTITAAAALAQLIGAVGFLKGLKGAFGADVRQGASAGAATPQDVRIGSSNDWARTLATAAFSARGGPGDSPEDVFRKEVLASLDALEGMDIKAAIKDALTEKGREFLADVLRDLPPAIAAAVRQTPLQGPRIVRDQLGGLKDSIKRQFGL